MELNSDLLIVQGILRSSVKVTGDYTKIRYRGGNEKKISIVVNEVKNFLRTKKYMEDTNINKQYKENVQEIVLFLVLNTEHKQDLVDFMPEYSHLVNVCPILSKCLLLNIVIQLNLMGYYMEVVRRLTNKISIFMLEDLMSEFLPNITHVEPEQLLESGFEALTDLYLILHSYNMNNPDSKINDLIENITHMSCELLIMLSSLNSAMESWKKNKIYIHLGYTLQKTLILLQNLQFADEKLIKFMDAVIHTTIELLKGITINVFCSWAEVNHEGQSLQRIIANEAYGVTKHFQNSKSANVKELIQILASVAQRPKSIGELIQEADQHTMICKVNLGGSHQHRWFAALLNTKIFENRNAINCVRKYSFLCNLDDVNRVLNICTEVNAPESKSLALKCASSLNAPDLIIACARFLYGHGLSKAITMNTNIEAELIILFNKAEEETSKSLLKPILLLFLQNPEVVTKYMLTEVIEGRSSWRLFIDIFKETKELLNVEGLFSKLILETLQVFQLSSKNYINFMNFLNLLLYSECYTWNKLMSSILYPCIEKYKEDYEAITQIYIVMKKIHEDRGLLLTCNEAFTSFFSFSLEIMDTARCSFFDFSNWRCQAVESISDFLILYYLQEKDESFDDVTALNIINNYYLKINQIKEFLNFHNFLIPPSHAYEKEKYISEVLRILPMCTTREWQDLFNGIEKRYDTLIAVRLLTDVMISLCAVAKTQENSNQRNSILALKYYITPFACIMTHINADDPKVIATQICKVILKLPSEIKEEYGLKLISSIPKNAFHNLKEDKQFLAMVLAFGNKTLCHAAISKLAEEK